MHRNSKCKHTSNCSIYSGQESAKLDIMLHRNIFCYRGIKGWSDCERYNQLQKTQIKEK